MPATPSVLRTTRGAGQIRTSANQNDGPQIPGGSLAHLPQFSSWQRAGSLTEAETDALIRALERLLAVAKRFKANTLQSFRTANGILEIFSQTEGPDGRPEDLWLPFHRDEYVWPSPICNQILAAGIGKHPVGAELECVFLLIPSLTGRGFGECFFTYILMVADAATGLIAGIDLLSTEDQPFEEMIDSIPDRFLAICDKSQLKPRTIATSSKSTAALLAFPAKALGCKVKIAKRLPAVDAAMASMPI